MTVISDYRSVPVLRDASFPGDLEAIVGDPANHTLEVVIGLTDVSDVLAFTCPQEGLTVAKAAVRLASQLPADTPEWFMAYARSFSVAASRFRGIGKLDDADVMFSLSHNCLKEIAGEHFAERADYCRRVGFQRIAQGAYGIALESANHSRRHFEFTESRHGIGCALVCRGNAYAHLKRFDDAAGDFRTALGLLDRDLGFIHVYAASTNLALVLIDGAGGEHDMDYTISQLQQVHELSPYEEGTVPFLTVIWAKARLLMKLRQYASAQGKLREVCAGWRSLDLPLELTTASLDLARCYFEQNLSKEIVQLAGEMFPLLSRFRNDEPAYRALKTFHRAALEGGLEADLIIDARAAQSRSRRSPRRLVSFVEAIAPIRRPS